MEVEESIAPFARPKRWLQKAAAEKLQQCARASSRRGRRSTPSQPAQSLLSSGLVGCSLCCARARHAVVMRSGRRQRRLVGRVLGHRADRGGRIGSVCARSRAVRGGDFPCASRPSHGTLARACPCECARSMWPALGEGEPSEGVRVGCQPVARPPDAIGPIREWVCDPKSGTSGRCPTSGTSRDSLCNGHRNGLNNLTFCNISCNEKVGNGDTKHIHLLNVSGSLQVNALERSSRVGHLSRILGHVPDRRTGVVLV